MPIVNYVREHIRFMEYATDEHLTASERLLWYALMHIMNQRAQGKVWPDEFIRISNDRLLSFCPMKYDTIAAARNALKQRGLIEFTPGEKNKKSPAYRMIYFYPQYIAPETESDADYPQGITENSEYIGGNMGGNIGYNMGGNIGGNSGGNTGDYSINYTGDRRIPDRYQRDLEDDEEEQEEAAARARARAEITEAWKNGFGKEPTPAIVEALCWRAVMLDFDEGVVAQAIHAAAIKGANSPIDYIISLLSDWSDHKCKTLQDVEEYIYLYDAAWGKLSRTYHGIDAYDKLRAFVQDRETDEERQRREEREAREAEEREERRAMITANKTEREKQEYEDEKARLDRKYGVTA